MLCEKCSADSGDMKLCDDCAAKYTEHFFTPLLKTLLLGMSDGELEAMQNEAEIYPHLLIDMVYTEISRRMVHAKISYRGTSHV